MELLGQTTANVRLEEKIEESGREEGKEQREWMERGRK
jgi:hypothetical protein